MRTQRSTNKDQRNLTDEEALEITCSQIGRTGCTSKLFVSNLHVPSSPPINYPSKDSSFRSNDIRYGVSRPGLKLDFVDLSDFQVRASSVIYDEGNDGAKYVDFGTASSSKTNFRKLRINCRKK